MKISGSYIFNVPQDMVWEALQDPLVLGAVVYACRDVSRISEHEYTGSLQFSAGAFRGLFQGTISLQNVNPPESYDVIVKGAGALGVVNLTGGIQLSPSGQQTEMVYSGDVHFGGRIASSAQRILEIATKAVVVESLIALNRYLIANVKEKQQP